MHNTWTDAENYLLVEKLVSKTEEEAWKEVAEKCDSSGTFETESYKCKAIRKYAIYHGLNWEGATLETVKSSPAGLAGWAEMNVVVPGIDQTTPATPRSAVPSAATPTGTEENKKGKGKGKNKRGRGKEQDEQEPGSRKTMKVTKTKKELSSLQTAESTSKEILQLANESAGDGKSCRLRG